MSITPVMSNQLAYSQLHAELELMQALLESDRSGEPPADTVSYPWNLAEDSADAYLAKLDQYATWESWDMEALDAQAANLANHCSHLWLQHDVLARFSPQVPTDLIDRLLATAQEVMATSASLADRLVTCVHNMLPEWSVDDLQVLARPLAYAMRGGDDAVNTTIAAMPTVEWAKLSEVEQARLSLAIARYTLDQLAMDEA